MRRFQVIHSIFFASFPHIQTCFFEKLREKQVILKEPPPGFTRIPDEYPERRAPVWHFATPLNYQSERTALNLPGILEQETEPFSTIGLCVAGLKSNGSRLHLCDFFLRKSYRDKGAEDTVQPCLMSHRSLEAASFQKKGN